MSLARATAFVRGHAAEVASAALLVVGYVGCLSWTLPWLSLGTPALVASYLAALHLVAWRDPSVRGVRVGRFAAALVLLPVHLVTLAIAAMLVLALHPLVPGVAWALVGALAATAAWRARGGARGVRVPWVLALGLVVAVCMAAWQRGDATVSCDEARRVLAQPGVTLAAPTFGEIARCEPGSRVAIGRYPRRVVEAIGGARWIVTTGASRDAARGAASPYAGSVCEVPLDGARAPVCIGEGTGQGVADPEPLAPIVATATGEFDGARGYVYLLSPDPPLRLLERRASTTRLAHGFVDRAKDTYGLFSDESMVILRQRLSDGAPRRIGTLAVVPSDVLYDRERHEGVLCGGGEPWPGGWGIVSVFTAEPFTATPVAPALWAPLAWSGGCDWSDDHGTVRVAVPPLGLLVTLDRASGARLASRFVGGGALAVAEDDARGCVYVGEVASGVVHALDLASGRELRAWRAGPYVRDLTLRRDGRELVATSTLGLVRIALGEPPAQRAR